jgi:hypothetical protein
LKGVAAASRLEVLVHASESATATAYYVAVPRSTRITLHLDGFRDDDFTHIVDEKADAMSII